MQRKHRRQHAGHHANRAERQGIIENNSRFSRHAQSESANLSAQVRNATSAEKDAGYRVPVQAPQSGLSETPTHSLSSPHELKYLYKQFIYKEIPQKNIWRTILRDSLF
jgi:hypothetical protein